MTIRSLRLRVAAYLLVPMAALALTLAAGGTWFVDAFVTQAYDRVLAGSLLSIGERLTMQDGQVTLDMPAAAFSMLSNSERDSIFYNVTTDGHFVTGYGDLDLPKVLPAPETLTYRDGFVKGRRVRIGMLLRPIYVTQHTALIQVAETTNGRERLIRRMLTALTGLGATLAVIGSLLIWFAVQMGLTPLDRLRREVERRRFDGRNAVPAFTIADVPQEAVPLVRALNDLLRQLNHAMTVLRQFTADASHQLRTPVAILRMHLDLLDRQPPGSRDWAVSRADIGAAVNRLDRLIAQLLTLAALEEGGARRPDPVAVDLAALARDVTADFAGLARRRDIDLAFEPEARPTATLDPVPLEEILRNLIDNALRYTPPGGHVCVRVSTQAGDDGVPRIHIDVEDDGPGIPPEHRALVFERFHRGERAEQTEGSGLGLAIVKAFSEKLGATVAFHDGHAGSGIRVRISLKS